MLKRTDGTPVPEPPETSLAGSLKRFPVQLNDGWRVSEDSLQWMLQRRDSEGSKNDSGWRGRSFCRTREALLRCIREYCGAVDAEALKQIDALPEWHD